MSDGRYVQAGTLNTRSSTPLCHPDLRLLVPAKPTVLYIAGWSRSGSTILANVLGSLPGFTSVGELRYIWTVGLQENEPCGCGSPLRTCPFWESVLTQLPGDLEATADEARSVLQSRLRVRHAPALIARRNLGPTGPLRSYLATLSALYRTIAKLASADVIVDSSKYPSDVALLRFDKGIDPRVLHLVRDPRAVAYSWQRAKVRRDRSTQGTMPRYGPLYSTANWVGFNLLIEALRKRMGRAASQMLRYEDFVAQPQDAVQDVASWLGHAGLELPFEAPRTAVLDTSHTVNGNPDRLRSGRVEVEEDDAWRSSLDRPDELTVTTLASPLLRRYGYSFSGARDHR